MSIPICAEFLVMFLGIALASRITCLNVTCPEPLSALYIDQEKQFRACKLVHVSSPQTLTCSHAHNLNYSGRPRAAVQPV